MTETIGKRIRLLRNKKNLTQQQLGDLVGVTKAAISQWELDQNNTFKEKEFDLLLEYLETTKKYLKTGDNNYPQKQQTPEAIREPSANSNEKEALELLKTMFDFQRAEWMQQGRELAKKAQQIREQVKREGRYET